MMSFLRTLMSGSGTSLVGLVLLAVTIFFVGPYIGIGSVRPFASVLVRVILIVLIFVVWGVVKLFKARRAARADEQLADDLVDSADGDSLAPDQSAEEVELLKRRFEEAISTLRATSKRKSNVSLYELPWFIIIGPPGSGKTTALVNSGLEFPLEQRFGKEALRGVGGTRNCDWWFTNDAVLLDTAGRYTTQDSHESVDRAAWEGFLDLLKKYRKRRPINGVIVAISLSDILLQNEAERNAQILSIRHRIQDLYQHFGIRFPVYMLFTKCDLVAGFIEFFDDLDQEGREQIWGTTFPLAEGKKAAEDDIKQFHGELDLLLSRLTDRMTWRMSQERDVARRAKIYNFPQQMRALASTLDNFLRDVFSSNRYEDQILVRGVYFTSGTQEGTPIDRMMSVMAQTFGMQEQALASFGGKGRSYFITDLFRRVIFQESGLAGVNPRIERRRRWLQAGAYVGSIGFAIIATLAWITSFSANRGYLGDVSESLTVYQQHAAQTSGTTASIAEVLPRLDSLRQVLDVAGQHDGSVPLHMRMWLYQGKSMQARVGDAYLRELNTTLAPTVAGILETRVRQNAGNPQLLYEYLKAYLMLGNPDRLDPQQLAFLVGEEWRRSYGERPEFYTRLRAHTDYLFENGVLPYPVNQRLIAGAQATLAQAPLSEFLYSRLKLDALGYSDGDLVLSDRLGIAAEKVFRRKSGVPLSEAISVLYTKRGFEQLYPQLSAQLILEAGKENWVLGRDDAGLSLAEKATVESQLREQYTRDYISTWRRLLLDLEILPFSSETQAMEVLSLITARPSVMRQLLDIVAENTALAAAPAEDAGGEAGTSGSRLTRLLGGDTGGSATDALGISNPGEPVAREFEAINRLVAGPAGQPSAIDPLLLLVADMQQELDASGGDALRVMSTGGGPAARRVRTEAGRQPEPVKSWLTQISGGSQALAASSARSELATRYDNTVLNECRRLITGRYPFERNSDRDVAIDDFGAMFGYGGVLDTFFNEHLAPFVDRTGSTWRLRSGSGMRVSAAALENFRRAEEIREAYFRPGSQRPEMRLTMLPNRLDAEVSRFILEVDGQTFDYRHGPAREWNFTWPGNGLGMARIQFEEASGGRPTVVEDGPWAFFRLLDDSRISQVSEIQYSAEFAAGGRGIEVLIQTNSVRSPLARRDLHTFSCPAGL